MASERGDKSARRGAAEVVPFPPLPPVPRAPRLPMDARQEQAARILGVIANVARRTMRVSGRNFVTGFHASAVDLGRLQTALARGVARLDAAQVEERWEEIRGWVHEVLRAWVQRCKMLRIEARGGGIRVELETQDDHGYYSYGFDVFPGKRSKRRRSE